MFYSELAQIARNTLSREIFSEIARQERNHMTWLQRQLSDLKDNPL